MKTSATLLLSFALTGAGCRNDCEDPALRPSPVEIAVVRPSVSVSNAATDMAFVAPAAQGEPSFENACAWIWQRAGLIVDIESHRGGLMHLEDQIARTESVENEYLLDLTPESVATAGSKATIRNLVTIRTVQQRLEERLSWGTDDLKYLEEQLGVLDLQSSVMDDVIMRMMLHRSDAGVGRPLQRPTCVARAGCSRND